MSKLVSTIYHVQNNKTFEIPAIKMGAKKVASTVATFFEIDITGSRFKSAIGYTHRKVVSESGKYQ